MHYVMIPHTVDRSVLMRIYFSQSQCSLKCAAFPVGESSSDIGVKNTENIKACLLQGQDYQNFSVWRVTAMLFLGKR